MAHRWKNTLTHADVTPKALFLNRRRFIGAAGLTMTGLPAMAAPEGLVPNDLETIRTYNNFYEFGYEKFSPSSFAHQMVTSPWVVKVDGLVDNPGEYDLATLLDGLTVEERIYRLRCVEAWSMVIPWNGIELADILNKVGVQAGARYVAFETALQPENMPGVRAGIMDFPYVEGLRLDEAMHPLTIMATGIYGEALDNANGAPFRLVVPWKYGFKSIKSVVRISLVADEPPTSWNRMQPQEYGFYANVNPNVDHPRWSQADERVIGRGLFGGREPTQMFNGYEEVASLYADMDLRVNY